MRLVHFSPSHPGGSGQTWFEVRWTDNLTANTTWSKFAFYNCLNFHDLRKSGRHSAFKIWSGRLWRGTDSHSFDILTSPDLLFILQYGPSHNIIQSRWAIISLLRQAVQSESGQDQTWQVPRQTSQVNLIDPDGFIYLPADKFWPNQTQPVGLTWIQTNLFTVTYNIQRRFAGALRQTQMSMWDWRQSEKIMLIKLFVITTEHKFLPSFCPVITL